MVIPASTVKRLGPWHIPMRKELGGLAQTSVLKCEEITTLPKSWLIEPAIGGPLTNSKLDEIKAVLLSALDFA